MVGNSSRWFRFAAEDLGPFVLNLGAAALHLGVSVRTLKNWIDAGYAPKTHRARIEAMRDLFVSPIDALPSEASISPPVQMAMDSLLAGEMMRAESLAAYALLAGEGANGGGTLPLDWCTGEPLQQAGLSILLARLVRATVWARHPVAERCEIGHVEAESLFHDLLNLAAEVQEDRPARPLLYAHFARLQLVNDVGRPPPARGREAETWNYLVGYALVRYLIARTVECAGLRRKAVSVEQCRLLAKALTKELKLPNWAVWLRSLKKLPELQTLIAWNVIQAAAMAGDLVTARNTLRVYGEVKQSAHAKQLRGFLALLERDEDASHIMKHADVQQWAREWGYISGLSDPL